MTCTATILASGLYIICIIRFLQVDFPLKCSYLCEMCSKLAPIDSTITLVTSSTGTKVPTNDPPLHMYMYTCSMTHIILIQVQLYMYMCISSGWLHQIE